MTGNKNNLVVGGISGYLPVKDNAALYDKTLMALKDFRESKGEINCFGKVLNHLQIAFGYTNTIAFLVNKSATKLLYSRKSGNEAHLKDVLSEFILEKPSKISGSKITRFRYSTLKENSFLSQYNNGIILLSNTFPLLGLHGSSIAFLFLGLTTVITPQFEEMLIDDILVRWFNAFEAKVHDYYAEFAEFKQSSKFNTDVFDKALFIHPWLGSADLCELCEIAVSKAETSTWDSGNLAELEEKMSKLASEPNYCQDYCWVCHGDEKKDYDQHGELHWYLWRLSTIIETVKKKRSTR